MRARIPAATYLPYLVVKLETAISPTVMGGSSAPRSSKVLIKAGTALSMMTYTTTMATRMTNAG